MSNLYHPGFILFSLDQIGSPLTSLGHFNLSNLMRLVSTLKYGEIGSRLVLALRQEMKKNISSIGLDPHNLNRNCSAPRLLLGSEQLNPFYSNRKSIEVTSEKSAVEQVPTGDRI